MAVDQDSAGTNATGVSPAVATVLNGMTWPYRSAYQGIAVSGTIVSFTRGYRQYLSDMFVFGCFRSTFVVFDVLDPTDSEWKIDLSKQDSSDLGQFGHYTCLGPFRTPYSQSITPSCTFNHPFDFKFSTLVGNPQSPMPSLVFQVFDVDHFGRQLLLGYGHVAVPTSSDTGGMLEVPLWLPREAQPFSDQVCGVYRPLSSRVDIANAVARADIATLAHAGSLKLQIQLTHILGKLKPQLSVLTPLSELSGGDSTMGAPAAATTAPAVASVEQPVESSVSTVRRPRIPASLAPLARVTSVSSPRQADSVAEEASPQAPAAETAPAVSGEGEMTSDVGFAAAVAVLSMSARARRRRDN